MHHWSLSTSNENVDHDSEQLNGIRVLDLWCGSTVPKDLMETIQVTSDWFKKIKIPDNIPYELFSIYSNNEVKHIRDYEPWFCRVLQEIGASPVGIDSGYLDEEFEHYALDLSQKWVLDFLENNSFDFVIANGLFDSPHLNERFPKEKIDEMRIELLNQSKRLLKNKDQKIECFW